MTGSTAGSVVLSRLEFDMLWEAERLPRRHVALDVPSPGVTHRERAELVGQAWESLAHRGLARGRKASGELVDMLNLLAHPRVGVDLWVWTDRQISGLAASTGGQALLGVLDGEEVWLIPARDTALAESAVSVAGQVAAGVGRSVSVPHDLATEADAEAHGDAKALVIALEDRGVELWQAQELAGMLMGSLARGQFGAQRATRDGQLHRAGRVVAYHDTDAGRYLVEVRPGTDGRDWLTVAPADNQLLAQRVWELLDEV
ncbi:ESAT-6 protein secretion system EspG family protein [Prauserella shujinwangii]|uniref:ESAT-6 protein secretion system EspG family protein n=1 Tax=Prauserella shujinwangii TaxID=1453103 RepID=A0A2T0LUG0_9PSEU|nr:ESX secretion-associated protein EspG [Prauserella shujinwangii]PRX47481.1 ESAT-6 protein secretion system EspG family protein [Prauserella shujinwangii]